MKKVMRYWRKYLKHKSIDDWIKFQLALARYEQGL